MNKTLALHLINVKPGGEAEIASKVVTAPSRLNRLTGRRPFGAMWAHVERRRVFFVAAARDQAGQIIAVLIIFVSAAIVVETILVTIFGRQAPVELEYWQIAKAEE